MEELVSLCKRRGFIFQSGEIYGGMQGMYDFGPLGVELKNNLKSAWWSSMVYETDNIEGLDASILSNPMVLRHSGHEDTFSDPMVDCRACNARWRSDLIDDSKCPACKSTDLTDPRPFNLMFKTSVGPIDDGSSFAYLRPETAQQIFTNFKNVVDSSSKTLPFGIAQIGKAFRNEITPRNFIFRVREFEQMELEFFVIPGTDDDWHKLWVQKRLDWWVQQGVPVESIELYDVPKDELAHYSKGTIDVMYKFPLGSHTKNQDELDITAKVMENKSSNTRLAIQDIETKKWVVPYVIEPSAGVERGILAILNEAYNIEELGDGKERTVLKLKPHLSPIKAAVIPLKKNNEDLVKIASDLKNTLQKLSLGRIVLENSGNIGKSYRRHDEIGTPLCITVDFESIDDNSVTVRDRDTMNQQRLSIEALPAYLIDIVND